MFNRLTIWQSHKYHSRWHLPGSTKSETDTQNAAIEESLQKCKEAASSGWAQADNSCCSCCSCSLHLALCSDPVEIIPPVNLRRHNEQQQPVKNLKDVHQPISSSGAKGPQLCKSLELKHDSGVFLATLCPHLLYPTALPVRVILLLKALCNLFALDLSFLFLLFPFCSRPFRDFLSCL